LKSLVPPWPSSIKTGTRATACLLLDWLTKNYKEHTFPYDGVVSTILATYPKAQRDRPLVPLDQIGRAALIGWSEYKK
jgi:hypothetical protein